MLPTLNGRIQTRLFMLATWGALITLVLTPVLPADPPYRTTYLTLAAVAVLGVGWELVYHGLQQFRWEKDWPTLFGLLTAVPEGLLVWFLIAGGATWLDGMPGSAFVLHFVTTWLLVWLTANGPMRVPFVHWRNAGGRIV